LVIAHAARASPGYEILRIMLTKKLGTGGVRGAPLGLPPPFGEGGENPHNCHITPTGSPGIEVFSRAECRSLRRNRQSLTGAPEFLHSKKNPLARRYLLFPITSGVSVAGPSGCLPFPVRQVVSPAATGPHQHLLRARFPPVSTGHT